MKLAVVHDLAEALAGDIAPFQNVSKEEKRRLEEEGLEKISATIGSDPIGESQLPSRSLFCSSAYTPECSEPTRCVLIAIQSLSTLIRSANLMLSPKLVPIVVWIAYRLSGPGAN